MEQTNTNTEILIAAERRRDAIMIAAGGGTGRLEEMELAVLADPVLTDEGWQWGNPNHDGCITVEGDTAQVFDGGDVAETFTIEGLGAALAAEAAQ